MIAAKKRILCINSYPDTCKMIAYVLSDYEVAAAHSLGDGLRRAAGERFDLYLLDYNLPDGTGLELCLLIRAFDKETPILLCSAINSVTEQHAITAGAQGCLRIATGFVDDLERSVSQLVGTSRVSSYQSVNKPRASRSGHPAPVR